MLTLESRCIPLMGGGYHDYLFKNQEGCEDLLGAWLVWGIPYKIPIFAQGCQGCACLMRLVHLTSMFHVRVNLVIIYKLR